MKHFQKTTAVFIMLISMLAVSQSWGQDRITVNTESGNKDVFISGMNLAWIDFANDMADAPLNENKMRKSIQDLRDAGGNAMRWWLFTNAAFAPKFGPDSLVSGLGTKSIENVVKALDIAQENGVVVSLCLLSFDLLQEGGDGYWASLGIIERNKKMITTDAGIQALIDNAIVPLVEGVGDHPAIMTWEIFNEPEGMTHEFGWSDHKVNMSDVQKMTNRIAAAIKTAQSGIPVSNGSHSMWASSDVPTCGNCKNYYSDSELVAAGGEATGTLDFVQVHYYPEHFDDDRNPFAHPASYWNIGKPIVIGEFPAGDWTSGSGYRSSMTNEAAFKYAYDNGYAGAMSWDMNGFTDHVNTSYVQDLETSRAGLEYLWDNYQSDILIKEVTRSSTDGNGWMQVTYDNVNGTDGAQIETQKNLDLSGATSLTVDVMVEEGAGTFEIQSVMKSSGWTWNENTSMCTIPDDGQKHTCEFFLADFDGLVAADVQAILLRTFVPGFSGKVWYDNVKAGSTTIDTFDEEFNVWGIAGGMDGGDAITDISSWYDGSPTGVSEVIVEKITSHFQLNDKELKVHSDRLDVLTLTNIQGKTVRSVNLQTGANTVDLRSLPAGIYVYQMKNSGVSGKFSQY